MHQIRSYAIWAFVLVLLLSDCQLEAAKNNRNRNTHGSGGRTPSNSRRGPEEHYRLTHGESAAPKQTHVQQQHAPQPSYPVQSHSAPNPPYPVQQQRPSAPDLPKSQDASKPIGWNVGHGDAHQKQTVSNTQSYPHPQGNLPPYSQGAPPPYSPHANVPHVNAAPPPYSSNAGAVPSYPGE